MSCAPCSLPIIRWSLFQSKVPSTFPKVIIYKWLFVRGREKPRLWNDWKLGKIKSSTHYILYNLVYTLQSDSCDYSSLQGYVVSMSGRYAWSEIWITHPGSGLQPLLLFSSSPVQTFSLQPMLCQVSFPPYQDDCQSDSERLWPSVSLTIFYFYWSLSVVSVVSLPASVAATGIIYWACSAISAGSSLASQPTNYTFLLLLLFSSRNPHLLLTTSRGRD